MLDLEDDVAHVKWGGKWRMPTLEEMKELVTNCTWEWTSYNGVSGQLVTGPNGNSIFLPATGYYWGTEKEDYGLLGIFWSATLDEESYLSYSIFYENEDYCDYECIERVGGVTVRPVTE